jgi:hypothetical protein
MEKEIITTEPEEIIVPDQIVDQVLAVAEKRLINIKRIKEYALSLTNDRDWTNLGGMPYLRAAGAEKVARPFGVRIKVNGPPEKIRGTDVLGEYYIWIYRGTASLGANGMDELDVQGICSSRDKFFSIDDGVQLPVGEVDEPNIMKKAYNNLVMQGITRILGLRNMTWEEVKHGIADKSKASSVNYKSRKADADPEADNEKKEIIAKMDRILTEQVGKDDKKKRDVLMEVTTFGTMPKAEKIDDLKSFSIGRIKAVYGKLKDKYGIKSEPKPAGNEPEAKQEPTEETEEVSGDVNAKPPVGKTAELPLGQKGGKR